MIDDALEFFRRHFAVRYGKAKPFAWQEELFRSFLRGNIPPLIDLPTGTGKTSIMLVWYLGIAWQLSEKLPITLPRRLIWVVNRRVVVDQATDEALKLKARSEELPCLAVSTLRGELADNGDWKIDPSQPAIVIGTVDMTGSRLLFSGYGDGPYGRAQHAGLLGVDVLFVNDEAHLTPAFSKLLRTIETIRPARKISGKQFRFCEVSATHTAESKQPRFPESLDADLAANETFQQRYTAEKRLLLHLEPDRKKAEAKLIALATEATSPRTIVFVERPEHALHVAMKLSAIYPDRVELLTGTMRGYERDKLTKTQIFRAFEEEREPPEPVWLVATSAGEVGVNITAERQITTFASADHLIQRFGRLNRFGGASGEAHVVDVKPGEKDPECSATYEWLMGLPDRNGAKDIRACSLRENPAPQAAFSAPPLIAELQEWLIELWCQTSGKVTAYPPVSPWLHGQQKHDPPQTSVAWRWDVEHLAGDNVTDKERESVLREFPVLAHERLTEPTSRLEEKFGLIPTVADRRILVRYRDGFVKVEQFGKLDWKTNKLDEALILLPPESASCRTGCWFPRRLKIQRTST